MWLGVPPINSVLVARPGDIKELDVVDAGCRYMGALSRLVGWLHHWQLTVGISLKSKNLEMYEYQQEV